MSTRTRPTPLPALVATTPLATPRGTARLFGTARGLLFVALPGDARDSSERWLRRETAGASYVDDPTMLGDAVLQLTEYFAGARRDFSVALDWRGTPFQRAVWQAVLAIPYGETRSYGEVAAALGRPQAARAVGAANGANPLAPLVPCHRLIGLDGSLRGYGAGVEVKRWLLDLERGERGGEAGGDLL